MRPLLLVHLSFAGLWLGCVLTEALFERALLGKGREQELILVALHKRVDLLVEVPAFLTVVVTGALMYPSAIENIVMDTKILIGIVAVTTNAYCVWLVFRRATAASAGDWQEFARLDHRQHQYGAIVLVLIVLVFALGSYAQGNA